MVHIVHPSLVNKPHKVYKADVDTNNHYMTDLIREPIAQAAQSMHQHPNIEPRIVQKMSFLYNAIEDGWKVGKSGSNYIFTKPHENQCEIYSNQFVEGFVYSSMKSKPKF
jgi:hypothetical protein